MGWAPRSNTGVFNHIPGGSNVLYMDGHVSFFRYGPEYPISDEGGFMGFEMGYWGDS